MTHYHRVFDKVVVSPVPLRLLAHVDPAVPDVTVQWSKEPREVEPGPGLLRLLPVSDGYLIDAPVSRIVVWVDPAGSQLVVHPGTREVDLADYGLPSIPKELRGTDRLAADTLVTNVLTALPTLWGRVTVHSASMLSPDGVVLLCARSGWGKSTISQHLARLGWELLDDDSITVDDQHRFVPMGARPRLRQDAAAALGVVGEPLPGYAGGKRALSAPVLVQAHDRLAATFHLVQLAPDLDRPALEVSPIPATQSLVSLTRNMMRMDPADEADRVRRVQIAAHLAAAPAFSVVYQRDVVGPDEVAHGILAALTRAAPASLSNA